MSVLKTILLFLALIPTVMTGGYFMKKNQAVPEAVVPFSLIVINDSGSVNFPARTPSPDVVYQIQQAIKGEDAKTLNALLLKHRFYLFPKDKTNGKTTSE